MGFEDIGVCPKNVQSFIAMAGQQAFVLEDIATDLGISVSEARLILNFVTGHGLLELRQVWVPLKKMVEYNDVMNKEFKDVFEQ